MRTGKLGVIVLLFSVLLSGIVVAGSIKLNVDDDSLNVGDEMEFSIIAECDSDIGSIEIDFGDGDDKNYDASGSSYAFISGYYVYDKEGDFDVVVSMTCDSESDSLEVEVENNDEKPEVSLVGPADDVVIQTTSVNFKFSVEDDFGIDNCVLSLYNSSSNKLEYSEDFDDFDSLDEEVSYGLEDFDDGEYFWKVRCEDSRGQEAVSVRRDFVVQTILYEQEKEVEEMLDDLDDFILKKKNFGLDEGEALEDLGIAEDLEFYRKRLLQIDQDLGVNLKYVSNEATREKREKEALEELEEIKEKIPVSFSIVDSEKFIVNSAPDSLEEVARKYADVKGLVLSERRIRNLGEANMLIQDKLSITTKIKKVEVKYLEGDEETFVLVKKEFDVSDSSYDTLLESFGENMDLIFVSSVSKLTGDLYEFNVGKDGELVYYSEDFGDYETLRDSLSVLFYEADVGFFSPTGYFSFVNGVGSMSAWVVFVLFVVGIVGYFGYKGDVLASLQWKKEGQVVEVLTYIEDSKKAVASGDLDRAKEGYRKVRGLYRFLPEGFRKKVLKKIEVVRIALDKAEISDLVREYEDSRRLGRVNEANILYEKIRDKYKRLPKKYQERVYSRLFARAY